MPISYDLEANFEKINSEEHLKKGLANEEVKESERMFGLNKHEVEIPGFFEYMLDRMTSPFYILQYIFCISFILGGYLTFGVLLLFFMIFTTVINYLLLSRSYQKIKDMAEKLVEVEVIRGGERVKIMNSDLVPGDVYVP